MINVCVPVLKRYDLLGNLIRSLEHSTTTIDGVYVIDNGRRGLVPSSTRFPVLVHTPVVAMGLAAAWNWFIQNASEERFIVNDDIEFAPHSIGAMLAAKASFVSCSFGFSCFLLRDECVRRVGLFDESISPGYAYFEDMDYLRRMKLEGVEDDVVQCDVAHRHSATPAAYSREEMAEHHRRFAIAQVNYTMKWEDRPSWEQLQAIGGAGANNEH